MRLLTDTSQGKYQFPKSVDECVVLLCPADIVSVQPSGGENTAIPTVRYPQDVLSRAGDGRTARIAIYDDEHPTASIVIDLGETVSHGVLRLRVTGGTPPVTAEVGPIMDAILPLRQFTKSNLHLPDWIWLTFERPIRFVRLMFEAPPGYFASRQHALVLGWPAEGRNLLLDSHFSPGGSGVYRPGKNVGSVTDASYWLKPDGTIDINFGGYDKEIEACRAKGMTAFCIPLQGGGGAAEFRPELLKHFFDREGEKPGLWLTLWPDDGACLHIGPVVRLRAVAPARLPIESLP